MLTWSLLNIKRFVTQPDNGKYTYWRHQFSSVIQSCLTLCYPWAAALQASLSITNSQGLLKLMSIESVMPSNHLILCHFLFLPSILPSIKVFSNNSVLCIRWPKYWSFSFNICPSNEHPGLIPFRMPYWPGVLRFMGSQRVRHGWATDLIDLIDLLIPRM